MFRGAEKKDQSKDKIKPIQDKSFKKFGSLPKYNHYTLLNINQAYEQKARKNRSQIRPGQHLSGQGRRETRSY